jgi:hypothetical protein
MIVYLNITLSEILLPLYQHSNHQYKDDVQKLKRNLLQRLCFTFSIFSLNSNGIASSFTDLLL